MVMHVRRWIPALPIRWWKRTDPLVFWKAADACHRDRLGRPAFVLRTIMRGHWVRLAETNPVIGQDDTLLKPKK